MDYKARLIEIADCLDNADRIGADEDEPEGAKAIALSDTLARLIAKELREAAKEYLDFYNELVDCHGYKPDQKNK